MTGVFWNLAQLEDSAQLARLNLELIADEGHPNPMGLIELEARMRGWLSTEWEPGDGVAGASGVEPTPRA